MTSNALNQAQNHGAWKVLVNGSFEYLHPFYFPLLHESLCRKNHLTHPELYQNLEMGFCKHLPKLQWMALQQMNVNIALILYLCRLHSTKGHSKLRCSDWSFRRCRGHPLCFFRGSDFNRTKSMWSIWALVWRWTEAISFCSGRKSRCLKTRLPIWTSLPLLLKMVMRKNNLDVVAVKHWEIGCADISGAPISTLRVPRNTSNSTPITPN